MTTVRLPAEVEQKLNDLSKRKRKSKSELIKEALEAYLEQLATEEDSYTLGRGYFGQFGSGNGSLSVTYKKRLKEKLRARDHTD
jgi:Arc/MetJ-type ribon-helix-helix transcriptional regulator